MSLDTILRAIPSRSLVQLAESDRNLALAVDEAKTNKKGEKKALAGSDARKIIQNEIRRVANKILAEQMTTKQRADAVAQLNIDHESNNPKSPLVHKKRLLEALDNHGVEKFLKTYVDAETLVEIGEVFDLELDAKTSVDKLASEINDQIESEAAVAFLESFPNDVLLDVAYEMNLCEATEHAAIGTVAEAIATQTEIASLKKKAAPKKKSVKVSKTKPKIAKGVVYDDVYQWYTVEELREYAKENEIMVSGSKKELIKRIIAWLEGDKENTTLAGKKEKQAAKKEKSAKKEKTTKKKSTKKSTSEGAEEESPKETTKKETTKKETKPTTKKAAPKPVEKETAEPAEEADLDLDNLETYDLAKLKAYCSEEGIKVEGKTKKAYIDAILAYNDEEEKAE